MLMPDHYLQANPNDRIRLEQVKDRVIVGNNAKSIYEHLVSLGNDPKHRQRWIWELMQNAQDSNATDISVIYQDDKLEFIHNGTPFLEEDITHVIFHGSSKPEEKTGKFGTGFMTTHLLSTKVWIRGNLENGRHFDFELNRTGNSPTEMKISLDISWDNFKQSIGQGAVHSDNTFTYIDLNDKGKEAVIAVLDHISHYLPPVLAFSNVKNVHIRYKNEDYLYKKVEPDTKGHITVTGFKNKTEPNYTQSFFVHRLQNEMGELAIPVDNTGNIAQLGCEIPRLFITFPLIGTAQAFPLPFLINSPHLQPSSEREKLWLSAESDTLQVKTNKEILETALTAYVDVVKQLIGEKRGNIHLLADLGPLPGIDWVDTKWYNELIQKIVKEIDELPLIGVASSGHQRIAMVSAKIPFAELPTSGDELLTWQLCCNLFPEIIPQESEAEYWRSILADRMTFIGGVKHSSSFTIKDLCKTIGLTKDHLLNNITCFDITPLAFIQKLVTGLESLSLEAYCHEYALLPVQTDELKKFSLIKQELFHDPQEIGEALKDIAVHFDIKLRDELLHKDIVIASEKQKLPEYKKDTVVASLVQIARSKPLNQLSDSLQTGLIKLFEWLLEFWQLEELAGLPVKMRGEKWDKMQVGKEPFLYPITLWQNGFQKYADLFPADFILDDCYARILGCDTIIEKLAQSNWLLSNPLYHEIGEFNSDEIRHMVTRRADKVGLSKPEDAEWKMTVPIRLSRIAYFNSPADKNVVDKARSASIQTRKLLEFIVEVLLNQDAYGFTRYELTVKTDTTSRTVGVYPSKWLYDVKNRNWIREIGNKANNRPSVESLLAYFRQSAENQILYASLLDPKVSRFLNFLEIGVGELLRNIRAGEDEEQRMGWDQSYAIILMNKNLTPQKVTALLGDPNFIKAYEQKEQEDLWRKQNQDIGSQVEAAFEKAFENLSGYTVKREPIGSDYIVECDCPHILLIETPKETKFTIEIKSSRSSDVKMTYTQGKTAYEKKENYLLCVVPLDGSEINANTVIQNARFITNISALLTTRVERVLKITETEENAISTKEGDDPNITTSIEGTNIRYVIGQKIWQQGEPQVISFQKFIDGLVITKGI